MSEPTKQELVDALRGLLKAMNSQPSGVNYVGILAMETANKVLGAWLASQSDRGAE